MDFTDLTKVLLQARRFYRPFDLETRPIRRVLHPFAGAISAVGFTIAFATFLWKDVVKDQATDFVTALQTTKREYRERFWSLAIDDRINQVNSYLRSKLEGARMNDPQDALSVLGRALRDEVLLKVLHDGLPKNSEARQFWDRKEKEAEEKLQAITKENKAILDDQSLSEGEQAALEHSLWRRYDEIRADTASAYEKYFENLTENKERYLDEVTYSSYFLYAGGLIIGVFGQLAGIEPKRSD